MNAKELNHALATGCHVVLKKASIGTIRYAYVSEIIKRRGKEPGTYKFFATVVDHNQNSATTCDPAELSFYNPLDALDESADEKRYGIFQNVYLKDQEYGELVKRYGTATAQALIDNLSTKMRSKGYTFHDHYATILSWAIRDNVKEQGEKSYDLDDFFDAALQRSYDETPK